MRNYNNPYKTMYLIWTNTRDKVVPYKVYHDYFCTQCNCALNQLRTTCPGCKAILDWSKAK